MSWEGFLVALLVVNGCLAFGYRVYRLTRGGPMADVIGQGILALVTITTALLVAGDAGWARWIAFGYACLFGLIVMPIWTLAVLIPLPPSAPDYAFTALYWLSLVAIGVAALAA